MGMHEEAAAAAELWDGMIERVRALQPPDWQRSTPCPRWDVHDLVAHCAGLQTAFDGSAPQPPLPDGWAPEEGLSVLDAFTEAGVVARREWTPEQLRDELDQAKAGHVARLEAADPDAEAAGPTGPSTEAGLFAVRMFDLWTHRQDLALALDEPMAVDDGSAAALAAQRSVLRLVPWLLVKRVGATDGAHLRITLDGPLHHDRILAVADGRARWEDDATTTDSDNATTTNSDNAVRTHGAVLTLLAAGRGDPDRWRADGLLDWNGPLGEAFVRSARMF